MNDVVGNIQNEGGVDLSAYADSMPQPFEEEGQNTQGIEDSYTPNRDTGEDKANKGKQAPVENSKSSLMDGIESESSHNQWKWSENLEGEGQKPQWMRENFKSVEDQAKAYNELVKKFGSFAKAPESYDVSEIENANYRIVNGDKNFESFKQIAKEMNMSQEGMNKIIKFFTDKVAPTFKPETQSINFEQEAKKLGDNWKEQLGVIHQWTKNHMPDKLDNVKNMVRTAEDARVLLDMIEKASKEPSIPDMPSIGHKATKADLDKKMAEAVKSGNVQDLQSLYSEYEKMHG